MADPADPILLVEDDPVSAALVLALLHKALPGLRVEHVETLADAGAALEQHGASCVLLDLSLPDASGVTSVARLLAIRADLAIVVMTGHDDDEAALEALRLGAQDYVVKSRELSAALPRSVTYAVERTRHQQATESAFQGALQRMVELDRMKSEFVSTVSHELRTPLTSMSGYLDMLVEGAAGALSEEQLKLVAVARRNCDRLTHLAEDLLALSRLESGRSREVRQPVHLAEVIADAAEAVLPIVRERALGWQVKLIGAPGTVMGDPDQLSRALLNLLSNAIKFTPDGGCVTVCSWCEDDEVVLSVCDTGIGISPDDQAQLFGRFYRSDAARRRAIQGTGLGLAIVAAIVEQHDGTVTVNSIEGSGSVFEVRLPTAGSGPTGGHQGAQL